MVVRALAAFAWVYVPLAADNAQRLIDRLDGPTKAKLLAALAGLVILGLAMILLTWLGGRAAKRYMNSGSDNRRREIDRDDWALKSLIEQEDVTDD